MARQRLDVDFDSLFPGDTFTIGGKTVNILPLVTGQLSVMARQLKALILVLGESGVTWDNYSEPKNLLTLSTVILEQFPDLLEEASNIALEDLQKLPLQIALDLTTKVIKVNIASRDSLVKNFKNLTKTITQLTTEQTKKRKSPKRSKS